MQNDEIKLYELLSIINSRKVIILTITIAMTLLTIVYEMSIKPLYRGTVLIEIGQAINNNKATDSIFVKPLDDIEDLKRIILKTPQVNVTTYSSTGSIVQISISNNNVSEIQPQLKEITNYILNRHQKKAQFYGNNPNIKVRMTSIIGEIQVETEPIKLKKNLTVGLALIIGLILGIFTAFFLEFIQNSKID